MRGEALARFAAKCRFDPLTGCVLWEGGKTQGRGNTAIYGSFWFEGRRWFAHRWAGVHIHGLDLDGVQAGHCCPHGPDTLCVQHIEAQTQADNLAEMHGRRAAAQSSADRQFWLFVSLGIEPPPAASGQPIADAMPFFDPPAWFRPFIVDRTVNLPQDADYCPF